MRNGIREKSAAEQVGYVVKPIHGQALCANTIAAIVIAGADVDIPRPIRSDLRQLKPLILLDA